jgi:hypothetical protein
MSYMRTIVGHMMLPDAIRQNNSVAITVKVPSAPASYAVGTFESGGDFQATCFLSVISRGEHQPRGGVGPPGSRLPLVCHRYFNRAT